MRKIIFHKNFDRGFEALNPKLKLKTIETIKLLTINPFAKKLKNHALKGKLNGKRAISVTSDIRIIFEQEENYTLIIMLDIGTHNQVY
jgi:addiction module RelE/StbE family toxin